MSQRFADRAEAGRQLAGRLAHLRGQALVVLALPRGGVPVAYEIAQALDAPLDVLNVRKLGVPGHEELAFGAVASGGVRVLNDDVVSAAGLTMPEIEAVTGQQRRELDRRERLYRGGQPAPALAGKTVVLVDDGIATGATTRAAVATLRAQHPARLVLAVPVAQSSVARELAEAVDELVCLIEPGALFAIGLWYDDFRQLDDHDVRELLGRAAAARARALASPGTTGSTTSPTARR